MHHDADVERFYTTRAWRKCRESVIKQNGGLCQLCLAKGLIEPAVHVHHKIALNKANLIALCEACHQEQHRMKRWRCDPLGHVRI